MSGEKGRKKIHYACGGELEDAHWDLSYAWFLLFLPPLTQTKDIVLQIYFVLRGILYALDLGDVSQL